MTAKQRAARAKFKAVVKEASKLRKKNPKLTQAQAVKQAWAISYSKGRSGKKIGYSKEREKIHKAATKEIKREKQKNPDRKKKELVSLAYQNAPFRAIGATKVKAKKSKRTSEMHTDTKSHNVNIRVISGIGEISDMIIHTLKLYDNKRQYHEKQYKFWINNAKQYPKDKKQSLKYARTNKNLVTYYTKQIAKLRLKIK